MATTKSTPQRLVAPKATGGKTVGGITKAKLQAKSVVANGGAAVLKRELRPRPVTLRKIRKYQKPGDVLAAKSTIGCLSEDAIPKHRPDSRLQATAADALQHVSENYLTPRMQAASLVAKSGGRVTITNKDFELVDAIMGVMKGSPAPAHGAAAFKNSQLLAPESARGELDAGRISNQG